MRREDGSFFAVKISNTEDVSPEIQQVLPGLVLTIASLMKQGLMFEYVVFTIGTFAP